MISNHWSARVLALSALILGAALADEGRAQVSGGKGKAKVKAKAKVGAQVGGAAATPGIARPAAKGRAHVARPGVRRGYGSAGPGRMIRRSTRGVAVDLREARAHLIQADHDYNGHRRQAIRHIDAALNALGQGGGSSGGRGTLAARGQAAGVGGPDPGLPQATSDQHLREAQRRLTAIHGQMTPTAGGNGRLVRAEAAIRAAVGELNSALAVR